MRNIFPALLVMALYMGVRAQNTVDCTHLRVTGIKMHTADSMVVTVFNSCNNCKPVLSHCVYHEMWVIRAVAPFDTIGNSKCYCHQIPAHQSSYSYTINSAVSSLPPITQLRVSLWCNPATCDDIPFDITSGITGMAPAQSLEMYPNPASGQLFFRSQAGVKFQLKVYSLQGALMLHRDQVQANGWVDVSALAEGIYIAEARNAEGEIILRSRLLKE